MTLEQKFELFEQMYLLAVELGGFRTKKFDDDLEEVVYLAKALHGKLREER